MAANTKYYHLTKPEGIDLVEVGDLNGNFDIIDGQMKANADATAGKQDALTFDSTPAAGSRNPIASGGIYTAIGMKQNTLTFDAQPVAGSFRPVYSNWLYHSLLEKQDDLTQIPTVSSLRESDYLFLERDRQIYKIRASAVIIPSGGDGIETENGDALMTEDGQKLLIDGSGDEP